MDTAEGVIADVTSAVPGHTADPFGAGWWVRMCRELETLRAGLTGVARDSTVPLRDARLRPAALNPSKIIACASNYSAHVGEMMAVQERVAGGMEAWMAEFDVFLKAPSSVIGPGEAVLLPAAPLSEGREIHHECELALVIGKAGAHIPADRAVEHILGYTICLDITVRGPGDRSRRKSYDTFTPTGPWVVTRDEIADPHDLEITLEVDGEVRQRVSTSGMTVRIPEIVAQASACMTLLPGDLILTGAPPGVGQIFAGERLKASISGIGSMELTVAAAAGD